MKKYDHNEKYTYEACGFSEEEVGKYDALTHEILLGTQKDEDGVPSKAIELVESAAELDKNYFRFVVMNMVMHWGAPTAEISLHDIIEEVMKLKKKSAEKKKPPAKTRKTKSKK